ncbi:MAG: hypothetical protein WCT05_02055 [Lentisphaeria bacterium]
MKWHNFFNLRTGLWLSTATFLLSCTWLLLRLSPSETSGEFQLSRPEPAFLGNLGEVSLEVRSWLPPEADKLRLTSASNSLDFSPAQRLLVGISKKGFRWQCRRFFWAVEFGNYPSLQASYGAEKLQHLVLDMAVLHRPNLTSLEIPREFPATQSDFLWPILCFSLLLAIGLDAGLAFWQRQQPRAQALRRLKHLQAGKAGGAELWQIWRYFANPSCYSLQLGAEIGKMRFAPGAMTTVRFERCRKLLAGELRLQGTVVRVSHCAR